MLYSPALVALSGILTWLILRAVAPLDILVPTSGGALVYIGLCYAAFFLGCGLAASSVRRLRTIAAGNAIWNGPLPIRMFWLSCALGLLGMMIRIYDRVVVRGVEYGGNAIDIREQLLAAGSSAYGAMASVLLPFSFMPLILLLASRQRARNWAFYLIAAAIFVLPMVESLQILSRSLTLITTMLAFAAWVCLRFDGKVLDRRILVPAAIGLIAMLAFSSAIFSSRLSDMRYDLTDSVVESGYAYTVTPNRNALEGLIAGDPLTRGFYETVTPNVQYYLHGFYEFGLLFNRPDGQRFGYGSYTFYPYTRVLALIFGTENFVALDDNTIFYRPGVFVTFFGPWWVDFGWMGVVLMLPVGYLMTLVAKRAREGYVNVLPLHLFHVTILFYMPVSNFLTSGLGFYLWHGFLLFALFTSFTPEAVARARDEQQGLIPVRS